LYEGLSYLILFFVLIGLFFKTQIAENKGKIFGLFLIGLFSLRLWIEFYKDVQVDFEQNMLLNMGQLLSIPFILAGIYFVFKPQK